MMVKKTHSQTNHTTTKHRSGYTRKHLHSKRTKTNNNKTRKQNAITRRRRKHMYVHSIHKRRVLGGKYKYTPFTPAEIDYLTNVLGFSREHIEYLEKRKKNGVNITSRMLDHFVQQQGNTADQVIEEMKEGEETDIESSNESSDEEDE